MPELPGGSVTFVFTDVEGSTRLLRELGVDAYAGALAEHRRQVRQAFGAHGGIEVDTQGDAFFVVFRSADDAVAGAWAAQDALSDGPIRVRMSVHTGTGRVTEEGYVGEDVHLAARIAAAGHGGQVLLSEATRATLEPRTDLVNLGEHQLKDFETPVAIFQLGRRAFPPLRTIGNTNLPRPASSFVGRAAEVADIVGRLRGVARFVTLTGPGGSGKTRLAIEAAIELIPSFRAGVFWVSLAPLRDPDLVLPAIAQTLGARGDVAAHVGDREILLVLDNLEQVVDAATDLAALVETCPNLRVLATSRERLRVRGEVDVPVPPLPDVDARRLFAERSHVDAADPDVLAIVRALDRLPLAVELAAGRASILTPAQIRARLSARLDLLRGGRDADPRQQTLRATIEWSYDLLEPAEQRLLARLAIFHGGWTLEAAETVALAEVDALEALVDKSLVVRRDDRFLMLETIRQFAAERLAVSDEREAVAARHTDAILALAEAAVPHLTGTPKPWLDALELEHDNIRAVLDRLEESRDTQRALQLAGALGRFWTMRGHYAEGQRRLEGALALDERPTAFRARALNSLALVILTSGAYPDSRRRAREAAGRGQAIYEALGDRWGVAHSSFLTGSSLIEDGRPAEARRLLESAGAEFEALGDDHYALLASRQLAWTLLELGDMTAARRQHEEVVRRASALGNVRMRATSLGALGEYDLREGDLVGADARLRESMALWVDIGELLEVAANLQRFAWLWVERGSPVTAARLLARAEALEEEIGAVVTWMQRENAVTEARIRAAISDVELVDAREAGRAMTLEDALRLAMPS